MYWFYKITKLDFRKGSKSVEKIFGYYILGIQYTSFFEHRKYEGTGSGKMSDV